VHDTRDPPGGRGLADVVHWEHGERRGQRQRDPKMDSTEQICNV
jgi:hypothetical protein